MRKPWPVLLMVRALDLGGTERQVTNLARALDRTRFSPHVACFRPGGFRQRDLAEAGVPVVVLGVLSLRGRSTLAGALALRRYVRQHGIVAVHTFDTPANLFGVPAALTAGVPVVISSQRAYRELSSPLERRLLRITDRMAHCVVANCEVVRERLVEQEGVPRRKVSVCYNGLDACAGVSRRAPAPGCGLLVGIASALRKEKDLPTLVRAFARVLPEFPRTRLVIVGDGPAKAEIEAARDRLGVQAACEFPGAVRDVTGWLDRIDVAVLPSRSEALSNSLMESMAAGCCAIASRVGGNPELVSHGETGLLFEPGDEAALAGCLRTVLGNEAERQRLAAAGRAFVLERFSLKAACDRMGEIYQTLIER